MKDLCFDRNTTSQHWKAVASPKSIEIHQYPSISASKSHSMRSIVAFHQHVVVQHVAALQHGCTATIRKTLQSNHIQFHSLCMDQHSLGARTWISIAPKKALRSNAWTVRTWLWCPCCSGNVPFRSDSAIHVVEVIACEILQICRDCRGIFSICLVRMKSDEVRPARDASCAVDRLIEGSLEVKLPAIWTDEKQRWEESERREE